jgi:predicted methyltransferase
VLDPRGGNVLDTATGLGYSAIACAQLARSVVTVELDEAVLRLARRNPWSRELFDSKGIRSLLGDVEDVVMEIADGSLTHVLHDPPVLALAGNLYSEAFYHSLFRKMKPDGRLFHYLGDLESASILRLLPGVKKRLRAAGFTAVREVKQAFGLVARRRR